MPTDIYARLRDLAASAETKPQEMRPILLRVITDLFILHPVHRPEEIRLFEEMADRLVDSTDDQTLANVARKLARCADAPAALLRRLRARGGGAAREILMTDARLDWRELRSLAASGTCDQACAIAGRSDLDREIVKILAGRPEREVARAIAANPLAPLAVEDMRLLCARGREDALLGQALMRRGEVNLDHLPLYLVANVSERARLVALLREANLGQFSRGGNTAPIDEHVAARLEAAALRQKRSVFAASLADMIGCDPITARKIVDDENGDALTLAFIAIGLPPEIAARIFLIAFPKIALSGETFERNLKLFAQVPRRDAQRVIAAIAGEPHGHAAAMQREQGRRMPLYGQFRSVQKEQPEAAEAGREKQG